MSRRDDRGLKRTLSPLGAWALAFGCSVGWGAFVMPGTTFLPIAGPVGTVLGIGIGTLIMLIIGVNYHYLINHNPDAGGTYAYVKSSFGYDHGYLNAWFLILTYAAISWANATALPLICRRLLGGLFQVGFHYEIAGFDVYMGEALLALAAMCVSALLCLRGRPAFRAQTIMALALFGGLVVGAVSALTLHSPDILVFDPPFPPGKAPISGVFTIIALAPWAFVGFESICHTAGEFTFSRKKSIWVLVAAVIAAGMAYALLAVLAVTVLPEGCATWPDYIGNLDSFEGIKNLPTFYSAAQLMGGFGTVVLALTTLGAIGTGLVGNTIAASRLLYALSLDEMLPDWFGELDDRRVPRNAILFMLCVSLPLPFLGRTAISWIVDVTTVGATIAYAYVSACAFKDARKRGDMGVVISGGAGLLVSLVFVLYFLVPNLLSVSTLSTESYLILAAWGILGFVYYMFLFRKDHRHRLGRSTATWVVLLALIIFTSTVWMRQATESAAANAVAPIQDYFQQELTADGVISDAAKNSNVYLSGALDAVGDVLNQNSLIQTGLIVVSLAILFQIYGLMIKREKQIEVEKVLAEESSKAKTSFLSNMSHEIRTPMNAIIGLDNIALKDPDLSPHTREQLEKIGASAKHLLGLINDILDMSRIESGRLVLKEEEFAFREFLDQINVMVNGQCADKGLNYECRVIGRVNDYYIGDELKLKQVIINILGNAVKFTHAPGSVTFTVEQIARFEGHCTLRFIMKDTGIGMSKEYLPKLFEAFSQEDNSTTNKYGSTGLGMAITKNIVEMMNGEIQVDSEKGVGTTFTVTVTIKASSRSVHVEHDDTLPTGLRALVVDDDEVACEHAKLVANAIGIDAELCSSGAEALERLREQRDAGTPIDLVLTDYKMPAMDGIAFTRHLREFDDGKTMVVLLTGYSWDDMQGEAEAAGVDGLLSKPLFTDSLTRCIQGILTHRSDAAAIEGEAADEGYHLEGCRVLVAEDMEINAEILIDLLDMEGVSAERAENGKLAVELFEKQPEGYFDAVLMDVRMPVMDGLGATRAIRELDRPDAKKIPIIAMTANAFDEDVQRSLQAGMTAHLSKPVEPERLYETLDKLIHAAKE